MRNEFNEIVASMEARLRALHIRRDNSTSYLDRSKTQRNIIVQETEITYLKKGYKICRKELKQQQKLKA